MNTVYDSHLEKILSSSEFKSENDRQLLIYLYEATRDGEIPKESQIAYDLFQRDTSGNTNQDFTFVRVKIHLLRKKLEHYYLTEGRDDKVVFRIPKGRYKIEFIEKKDSIYTRNNMWKILAIGALVCLGIVVFVWVYLIWQQGQMGVSNSSIWKDIVHDEKPVMIVLGDYYFFQQTDDITKQSAVIRDYSVNNSNDFQHYISENSNSSIHYQEIDFSYLAYGTPFYLKALMPVLIEGDQDFEICLMSRFNMQYLQQYNVIFIGLFKTSGFFNNFFLNSNFTIDTEGNIVSLIDKTGKEATEYHQIGKSESMHDDYSIVAKYSGPNRNTVMLFLSFHDIGVIQSVKYLTNPQLLKTVQEKFKTNQGNTECFEILFKVNGINRTDLSSEIMSLYTLDPSINYWDTK